MRAATIGLDIAKQVFSSARGGQEREDSVPAQAEAERGYAVLRRVGTVFGWDIGQRKRALLGSGADRVWPHCATQRGITRL
jgi:hypothetical protein